MSNSSNRVGNESNPKVKQQEGDPLYLKAYYAPGGLKEQRIALSFEYACCFQPGIKKVYGPFFYYGTERLKPYGKFKYIKLIELTDINEKVFLVDKDTFNKLNVGNWIININETGYPSRPL